MTTIYDVIKDIRDFLTNINIVNRVTFGDISDVDLDKTTLFPLVHFFISSVTFNERTIQLELSFLFLDIVDIVNDYSEDPNFQDNQIDIFNTQLAIANELVSHLRRGDLYVDNYHITDNPTGNMFKDRFENQLAGWSINIDVEVPNNLSICP